MKLSTKGHYGMHAMMDLAERYGQGNSLLRELCEAHGFSEKYLEQLLRSLRQAGLVESVRGAKGGYWLTRDPDEITVLEIVESLEGDLKQFPSKCGPDCKNREACAMLETWHGAADSMRERLAGVTLGDLVRRQAILDSGEKPPEYSI